MVYAGQGRLDGKAAAEEKINGDGPRDVQEA